MFLAEDNKVRRRLFEDDSALERMMEDDTVPEEEVKVLQEELIRSIYNDSPMLNDPEPCDIPGSSASSSGDSVDH